VQVRSAPQRAIENEVPAVGLEPSAIRAREALPASTVDSSEVIPLYVADGRPPDSLSFLFHGLPVHASAINAEQSNHGNESTHHPSPKNRETVCAIENQSS
jgi:hypothetical protein